MQSKEDKMNRVKKYIELQERDFLGFELSEEEKEFLNVTPDDVREDLVETALAESLKQLLDERRVIQLPEAKIVSLKLTPALERAVGFARAASIAPEDINLYALIKRARKKQRNTVKVPLMYSNGDYKEVDFFEVMQNEQLRINDIEEYTIIIETIEGHKILGRDKIGRLMSDEDVRKIKMSFDEKNKKITLLLK